MSLRFANLGGILKTGVLGPFGKEPCSAVWIKFISKAFEKSKEKFILIFFCIWGIVYEIRTKGDEGWMAI